MRTVLVCVRTSVAAQAVASCAARLGLVTFRTAASEAEVMAQLAQRPAELILVDAQLCRADAVAFTRQALTLAPGATLVLFGAVDPRVAAATVGAGARGLIRGDADPVSTVAKALLLISSPRQPVSDPALAPPAGPARIRPLRVDPPGLTGPGSGTPAAGAGTTAAGPDEAATAAGSAARAGARPAEGGHPVEASGPTVVPIQRRDLAAGGDAAPGRHPLTERELQVLRGMAEGKSNAEIGRDLYVSEDTVKTHARRLFRKLSARDRAHAVAVGFRSGALS